MGRPLKPYSAEYRTQKGNARRRGIEWQFSYESWIDWWGDDINRRGREKDNLVMSRLNDVGPYHPDNVSKNTASKNVSDGNVGKIVSMETRSILSEQKQGKSRDLNTKKKISETLKIRNKLKETEKCL